MANISLQNGVVRITGELTAKTVTAALSNTPEFSNDTRQVDLAEVQRSDSAGLAMLIHWQNLAAKSSVILQFNNVPNQLKQLAQLGGLDAMFSA